MYKNYFKIALRNLARYKGFTLINIAGLTLGITGCLLIGLFVWDELQYDRFIKNGDTVFRIYDKNTGSQGTQSIALVSPMFAPTLKKEMPEVENTLRMMNIYEQSLFKAENVKAYEEKGIVAESSFFDFFSLPLLAGNPATALVSPDEVVITKEIAEKYFGNANALGKIIYIGKDTFRVSGVMKTIPEHFHLDINYITSFARIIHNTDPQRMQSWIWQQFFTYVKLKKNADSRQLEKKFQQLIIDRAHPVTKTMGFTYIPYLQPLKDIHLGSANFSWDIVRQGNIVYVKALSIIAVFVLLIACFNFINLSTARSLRRAKEVGIRKVVGANKKQLLVQFTGESILLAFLATLLAPVITFFVLPSLNHFTGKNILFRPLTSPGTMFLLLGLCVVIGILAGLYPAVFMAGFRPVSILKGMKITGLRGDSLRLLRKGLVVIQFSLSVFLIVCTAIVFRQVNFMEHKDLGFQKDQVIYFPMRGEYMYNNQQALKNDLLQVPGVISATIGYGLPGDIVSGDDIIVPDRGEGKIYPARQIMVDHDYIKTMGLEVIAGRDFSRSMSTDPDRAFILNETAVKELGLGTPEKAIGKPLHWKVWFSQKPDSLKKGIVIGVVKDFHISSLHKPINTAVLQIYPSAAWKAALKIKPDNINRTIAGIDKVWNKFSPEYPLAYQFLDENFEKMYRSEEKLNALLAIFTVMAIFIGCLGLFGLATYAAEQRIKEIGIRKVLGASVSKILVLLSKDFVLLLLISMVLAFPLAWWTMNNWLQDFAYRIKITAWVFVTAGVTALLIALMTVSFQAIKAAIANPVKSLRTE